jgi:beta-glucosidase
LFDRDAEATTYGYWHGYAKFEAEGIAPRYPFGHGLSYTRFSYRALMARRGGERIEATVAVRNDGAMAAEEVVQMYVGFPGAVQPRARKSLQGFVRVSLAPGETKLVRLQAPLEALKYRDPAPHGWRLEPGEHRIIIARSAMDPSPLTATIRL